MNLTTPANQSTFVPRLKTSNTPRYRGVLDVGQDVGRGVLDVC